MKPLRARFLLFVAVLSSVCEECRADWYVFVPRSESVVLRELLEDARKSVYVRTPLLSDMGLQKSLLACAQRGVRVQLLLDSDGGMNQLLRGQSRVQLFTGCAVPMGVRQGEVSVIIIDRCVFYKKDMPLSPKYWQASTSYSGSSLPLHRSRPLRKEARAWRDAQVHARTNHLSRRH